MAGAVIFNSRAIARRERAGAPSSAICFQAVSLMASCKFGICFSLMGLTILFSKTKHCKYTVFSYFCQGNTGTKELVNQVVGHKKGVSFSSLNLGFCCATLFLIAKAFSKEKSHHSSKLFTDCL